MAVKYPNALYPWISAHCDLLKWATLAVNSAYCTPIGDSPFFLYHHRDPDYSQIKLSTVQVLEHFNENLKYNIVTGKYSVGFPWKENSTNLPSNYAIRKGRLGSL